MEVFSILISLVVNFKDMKQTFLALNCLYRGSGTLLVNLIQKISANYDFTDPWLSQYADGTANYLHEIKLNPIFAGLSFTMLSYYLYKEFQVTLIGVNHKERGKNSHVVLNPGKDYEMYNDDTIFVIANSLTDLQAISSLVIRLINK